MPKRPSIRGVWLTLGVMAVATAAVGWYTVNDVLEKNPPGYCAAQKRYIADVEFIRTAVALYEWEASRKNIYYDSDRIAKNKYDRWDNGGYHGWERSRARSDCCAVYRDGQMSIVDRVFGSQEVEVVLYLRPENRGDGFLPFAFDICGTLRPHEWGYRLPANIFSNDGELSTSNYQIFIGAK